MTALLLGPEMGSITRWTRRMLGLSLAIHILLLLLLMLIKETAPDEVSLTEITWLEAGPGDGEPAGGSPVPAAVESPVPLAGLAVRTAPKTEDHFVPEASEEADVNAEAEVLAATEDRIAERLASMQKQTARPAVTVATGVPGPVTGLASMGGIGMGGLPGSGGTGLTRGGGGGGRGTGPGSVAPLEMKRSAQAPAPVMATIVPKTDEKPAAPKRSSEGAVAQRTLAGATLLGPVADRRLLNMIQPKYPDWAKQEGVEATVRIYFVVLENGYLKENLVVQKTSGYQDFDANALEALRGWRFEPLPAGSAGEQWGEITFRYRLSSAG